MFTSTLDTLNKVKTWIPAQMHYRNDKDVSIVGMRNPKRGPNDVILITEKCLMLNA